MGRNNVAFLERASLHQEWLLRGVQGRSQVFVREGAEVILIVPLFLVYYCYPNEDHA